MLRTYIDTHVKPALVPYQSGEKPIVTVENAEFGMSIMRNGRKIAFHLQHRDCPIATGKWLGFWDRDLQEVCGIDKSTYDELSIENQMAADATVQLTKYIPTQFWRVFHALYPMNCGPN